ncbi:hypothetical protein [Wolbachia endosymbiont (group A) of Cheilosia soror]|uniref:hypothetical protein n=1 Tax=Wolbachia endosymbiont (group A) of Cheilosia soror TaxID=2953995 RepID=UPI0021F8768E|nr:hypothetical protein [Wolbachia endosymbiont (group A) of Cheilosia soror]
MKVQQQVSFQYHLLVIPVADTQLYKLYILKQHVQLMVSFQCHLLVIAKLPLVIPKLFLVIPVRDTGIYFAYSSTIVLCFNVKFYIYLLGSFANKVRWIPVSATCMTREKMLE